MPELLCCEGLLGFAWERTSSELRRAPQPHQPCPWDWERPLSPRLGPVDEALAPDRCCAEHFHSVVKHGCLISESQGSKVIASRRFSNEASAESTLALVGGGSLVIGNEAAAKLPLPPPRVFLLLFFYIYIDTSSKQLWEGRWCQEKLSCLRHLIPN